MRHSHRILVKTLGGSLGFIPALTLLAAATGISLPEELGKLAIILNLPAVGAVSLAQAFHATKHLEPFAFIAGVALWSCFLAWVCWKYTAMLLGEDELGGHPFDCGAWCIRFGIGFIIGFLTGWRFVRNSPSEVIIIAMIATGIFGGLVFGAWRQNFWHRPL